MDGEYTCLTPVEMLKYLLNFPCTLGDLEAAINLEEWRHKIDHNLKFEAISAVDNQTDLEVRKLFIMEKTSFNQQFRPFHFFRSF